MLPAIYKDSPIAQRSMSPINRLFDQLISDELFVALNSANWRMMPLSLWEDENSIYVEADTPGLTDKDIDVSVKGNELVIRGERKQEQKGNGYDTRHYGRFEQRVTLPAEVDANDVEAKLSNGVLSLSFPKSEGAKPKRITLKSS